MRSLITVLTQTVFASLLLFSPLEGQPAYMDTATAMSLYPLDLALESSFEDGVAAWTDGRYEDAYASFKVVIESAENRRTTAAMLMGGRSLLATGRYAETVGLLTALIRRYPKSRYYPAALALRDIAQERYNLRVEAKREIFQIGVLLPMSSGAVRFTRSAFEGIRMAVDQFNERGGRSVRILFEDSGAEARKARAAARRLIQRTPDVIIGPLFSEEAIAVADIVEDAGIPLLVPLATDGAVTENRRLVFQANPTYEMRGRLMARRVVKNIRNPKFGVIADSTSFAGRMAEGFIDEAVELGASIPIIGWLGRLNDWYALSDDFDADTLMNVDGLYVPVTGDDARGIIDIALTGFDRSSPRIPLFGNGEWSDNADVARMAQHQAIYAVDFQVDSTEAEVIQFDREYRRRIGQSPDKPAFVGYDVTRFLLQFATEHNETASLPDLFRSGTSYQGLGVRLFFGEGQVNQSVFFLSYGDDGVMIAD